MAAFIAVGIIALGAAGVDKYRKRKLAKQQALEAEAARVSRERYFQSHKSREAAEERRRLEDELQSGDGASSSGAAALYGLSGGAGAPPPYIKDAPGYEEHHKDTLANDDEADIHPALRGEAGSNSSKGRSSKQSESRPQKRRHRRGDYFGLIGAAIKGGS